MSYGHSMEVLRRAIEWQLAQTIATTKGALKRDVCADARTALEKLVSTEEFDPWDGPVDFALAVAYDDRARQRRSGSVGKAVRWLEVAHDKDGTRVDRRPEQLSLLEAHEAYTRRSAQHDADGVMLARWQRVLAFADRVAAERGVSSAEATLGDLVGVERLARFLRGEEEAA